MAFLTSEGVDHLVEKLSDSKNIKIPGNQYGNRVNNVVDKLVEKADNVTKAVEQEVFNDSKMFKVGTGDVDVSSDVEDGFGKMGLRGKTYQNIMPSGLFDSKEVWYSHGANLNNMYSNMEGGYLTLHACESFVNAFFPINATLMKPNTTYTVVLEIKECNLELGEDVEIDHYKFAVATTHPSEAFTTHYYMGRNQSNIDKGVYKIPFTTKSNFDGVEWATRFFVSSQAKSGSITFRFYILEGDYTNTKNLPNFIEGINGVGDKSKNLFNPNRVKFGKSLNANTGEEMNTNLYVTSDFIPVLQQTYYTVKGLPVIHYYNESKEQIAVKNTPVEGVIRTPQNCKWIRMRNYDQILITEQKLLIKKSSFILGTYDTFEPYYDNYAIDVLSCGRNLWNPKINLSFSYGMQSTCKYENNILTVSGIGDGSAECYSNAGFITVETKEDTDYYFHCKTDGIYGGSNATDTVECFTFGMDTQKYISFNGNPDGFTFNSGKNKSIGFRFDCNKNDLSHIFYDFNLTETKTKIDYEPYKEDKAQILLDEPLMRLPNGVCDEITRDGKLIRRVGKIVLDDTIDYQISGWTNQNKTLALNTTNPITNMKVASVLISNYLFDNGLHNKDIEGIVASGTSRLVFRILKTKLTTDSINGAKIYLKDNPITTYYELETPIITKLPAPYLRIFKDGHLTFNTMVAPESTHKVQLNKSAQIESCIKQVSLIGRRVENMEALYDDLLLQTSRDVDLLSFDYNLETGDE